MLSSFNGQSAQGSWTLFIADVSHGDQSTLQDWTLNLEIAAVPEPASLVEGSVAVLFLGGLVGFYRIKGRKQQPLTG
jgi:subtilisin-like proprotein convertase family protein